MTDACAADFRSDTLTLPTAEMYAAIATAPLGDAARGEDPTVTALERLSAEMTGKDEAIFLPSGAMANLCALLAHGCRGGEVVVEANSHLYNAEGGGLSVVAGALARPVSGRYGVMNLDDVGRVLRTGEDPGHAPTRLVCVENTHNDSGGCALPLSHLAALAEVARAARVPLHMDGARLFNAVAAQGVSVRDACRHVDSAWFALCKGLGCPVGAVLVGGRDFIARARRAAKLLGGGMRQSGILAAAGLVALRDPMPRHRRDHALARELAQGLAAIDPRLVELDRVETNLVNCYLQGQAIDAQEFSRRLAKWGVRVNWKPGKVRFVTHSQVDEKAVRLALHAAEQCLA